MLLYSTTVLPSISRLNRNINRYCTSTTTSTGPAAAAAAAAARKGTSEVARMQSLSGRRRLAGMDQGICIVPSRSSLSSPKRSARWHHHCSLHGHKQTLKPQQNNATNDAAKDARCHHRSHLQCHVSRLMLCVLCIAFCSIEQAAAFLQTMDTSATHRSDLRSSTSKAVGHSSLPSIPTVVSVPAIASSALGRQDPQQRHFTFSSSSSRIAFGAASRTGRRGTQLASQVIESGASSVSNEESDFPDHRPTTGATSSKEQKQQEHAHAHAVKGDHKPQRGSHNSNNNGNHNKRQQSSLPSRPKKQSNNRRTIRSMFQNAKGLERRGKWRDAVDLYHKILAMDPADAHTHLALARLAARRERNNQIKYHGRRSHGHSGHYNGDDSQRPELEARKAFQRGIDACPHSVHLHQAFAVYEEACGHTDTATQLFEKALRLDPRNPYVCHAFGLMQKKLGNIQHAEELFEQALEIEPTAALVCSLGEIHIAHRDYDTAQDLYSRHLMHMTTEKDKTEVYLASAWLQERYYVNYKRARQFISLALQECPTSGLAQVAMARLEGRMQQHKGGVKATIQRLSQACETIEKERQHHRSQDGRLFNTWASMEVQLKRFGKARNILQRGMNVYPNDHWLVQAAGKVEERVGNYTFARDFYEQSRKLRATAPTLVALAMLELKHPQSADGVSNFTLAQHFFEEALLVDPRHGPAYNAYGTAELRRGDTEAARSIFQRGVQAGTSDAASLYHGYGKLELSLGNVDKAREILMQGFAEIERNEIGMDTTTRDRAKFLIHTLGTLELNSNNPRIALEVFDAGIERCGNSSQLLLGAALCNVRLGKEDDARVLFERSVLSDKSHAQAWQAWGVMEMRAGNFDTAKTLLETGMKSSPQHAALWKSYAVMEIRRGHLHNAQVVYASGIKKCPKNADLYQSWASLELRMGNNEFARKLISKALTLDKQLGQAWQIAAAIEKALDNDGLAGLLLRRGIECAPDDAELYKELGSHLLQEGKVNDARQVLEKGIEVNPMYAPLYHSLAELEARVFNIEGLSKLNKLAAEMFNTNSTDPTPSSSHAWGNKLRARRSRGLSKNVAALAQTIVEEDDLGSPSPSSSDSRNDAGPMFEDLDNLQTYKMEDELVDTLLNSDSIISGEVPLQFVNETAKS